MSKIKKVLQNFRLLSGKRKVYEFLSTKGYVGNKFLGSFLNNLEL